MLSNFSIIITVDNNNGISKNGYLPWNINYNLMFINDITKNTDEKKLNVIIMGKNTFKTVLNSTPFNDRINVVLTSTTLKECKSIEEKILLESYKSFDKVLIDISESKSINNTFVIGGLIVFNKLIDHPNCNKIILVRILESYDCNIDIPKIPYTFELIHVSPIKTINQNNKQLLYYIAEYNLKLQL
jgi:dihydrofolate reductase